MSTALLTAGNGEKLRQVPRHSRLILRSFQSPGDVLMLTAAVRDLHLAHPGKFQTDVRTSAPALWENNPYITALDDNSANVQRIDAHYPLVHQSDQRPYHFLHGYAQFLSERLGVPVPLTRFAGDIHLSAEERGAPSPLAARGDEGPYWIVVAGGKYDFTAKWWNPASYQAVIDHFQGRIQFVQCGEAGHFHPPLKGVINLVGQTDTRQFVLLMRHADGVLCPVTFAMHLAAAVEPLPGKPRRRACVVVAGGREPAHWEQYPGHQFHSTVGMLPCCQEAGCWRSRCQLVGDGNAKDRQQVCERPVQVSPSLRIPRCQEMISPGDVIRSIERYYAEGVLKYRTLPAACQETPAMTQSTIEPNATTLATPLHRSRSAPQQPPAEIIDVANVAPASAAAIPVLIDFRHGLGDAVQLTSVLMHLQRRRPDWQIAVAAGQGKHTCFGGLCERALVRDRQPIDRRAYRQVYELAWDECPTSYADCPSTKAEHCLKTVFDIEPVAELCRYQIATGPEARARARCYLEAVCGPGADRDGRYPAVLLHYQANTSTEKKNLSHEVAREFCQAVIEAGFVPVILDWDRRSPLPDGRRIHCPAADSPLWGNTGTGDAEALAALIEASTLFVGVDSGPLHVAGATATPTIGVWTGHHPLHYFGLADNVAHLVPEHHASLLRGDRSLGQAFFQRHYRHQTYQHFEPALLKLVREMLPGDDAALMRSHQFWVRRDNVEQDLVIVRDIAEQDSYRIAELELPGPVAVDVGAHIGVFSRAFRQRHPSARVIAVECCPENIPALERNIGDFATIVPAALTYDADVALLNAVYPGCVSTGGSTVISRAALGDFLTVGNGLRAVPGTGHDRAAAHDGWAAHDDGAAGNAAATDATPGGESAGADSSIFPYWLDGRPLATLTLEALMAQAGIDHIDVLKLDCEGSEFSILENTTSLDRIGVIVGEYHGRERFLELVARKFAGWPLRILRDGDPGTFWLTNPRASQRAGFPARQRGAPSEVSGPPPDISHAPANQSCHAAREGQATESPPAEVIVIDGVRIDVDRGVACQLDRSHPRVYDEAEFAKYLAYEGTELSGRLGQLRTALVKRHCRRVLDVGIGSGTFLKHWAVAAGCCGRNGQGGKPCRGCTKGKARRGGAENDSAEVKGYGFDINPAAIEWLRERNLFVDPYAHLPPEIEGLTFWDSLEHLADPAALLARMRVGMFAFISLPVFDDLTRLRESKHYRPNEHLYYFTDSGLRRFMADEGFDLLEANTAETKAGRESIGSYAFRKMRGPKLAPGWGRRAVGDPLREIVPGKPLVLRTLNGIGDLCWLMVAINRLKRRLDIPRLTLKLQLAGDSRDGRAEEFARRFTEVDEVVAERLDVHLQPAIADRRLRYVPNGYDPASGDYTLQANGWLEWEGRLEQFLPDLECDWDVLQSGYRRDPGEIEAARRCSRSGTLDGAPRTGHVCIHLCSRRDNTLAGMNRDRLWRLEDWRDLLLRLREITDLPVYVLGAAEDAGFAAELMRMAGSRVPLLYDCCGATSTTLAIEMIRQSSLMVSFASGLAVAACYLGVPTVAFWNAEGHSISPTDEAWFSDSFATNWVPPATLRGGLYYPAVYGRDDVHSVFAAVRKMTQG